MSDDSVDSREYVAEWLKQVPAFMKKLGIKDRPDLAATLQYLGSGAGADVVFLGERGGTKRVLKVTSDGAQAALSMEAFTDKPRGVVPVYDVVETEIAPRAALPELSGPGEEPFYSPYTWGIVEKFVVPFDSVRLLGSTRVAGMTADELLKRYAATWRAYDDGVVADDPRVEKWRQLYAAALKWTEETCEAIGSQFKPDMHEGNWGVDPETGDLLLVDLGQCYVPTL